MFHLRVVHWQQLQLHSHGFLTATTILNKIAGPLLSQMDAIVADGDMGDTVPTTPAAQLFSPNHSTFNLHLPPLHSTLLVTRRLPVLARL